jgi:hypothetical protein
VAVVLVKPAAIDTPYPEHAGNHLGVAPKHQAPVYAPDRGPRPSSTPPSTRGAT